MRWSAHAQTAAVLFALTLALAVSYSNESAVAPYVAAGALAATLRFRPAGLGDALATVALVPLVTEHSVRVLGVSVSFAEMFLYLFAASIALVHPGVLGAAPAPARRAERLIFAIAVAALLVAPLSEDLKQAFNRVREFILPMALIALMARWAPSRTVLAKWRVALLGAALVSTGICFVQFLTGRLFLVEAEDLDVAVSFKVKEAASYLLFSSLGISVDNGLGRGLNYFSFGYSEMMFIPLALLSAGALWARRWWMRAASIALALPIAVGILLSGSRSVLLIALCGVAIQVLWRARILRLPALWALVLAFPAALYLAPSFSFLFSEEEMGTLFGRLDYIAAFPAYAAAYPLQCVTGTDIDNFLRRAGIEQPPHHFVLFGVARDGIIVTVLFVALLVTVLHRSWHAIDRSLADGANGADGADFANGDRSLAAVKIGLWTGIFLRIFFYGQTSYLTWSTPHNIDLFLAMGLLVHLTAARDG
jgi:hypothetical protein